MTRRLRRPALLAAVGLGMLAPGAAAVGRASLTIKVPAKVRPGQKYVTKVLGSYDKSQVHGSAYLWAAIQYSASACKPTAQAESRLPQAVLYTYYDGKEPGTPFIKTDSWRAGNISGTRHVCAYLYTRRVSTKSSARPIAAADASYRDV